MDKIGKYFKSLCDVTSSFEQAFNIDDLLSVVVKRTTTTMEAKACALFLKTGNDESFVISAQTGLSDSYTHAAPKKAKKVIDKAVASDGYLAVKNAGSDPRVENHEAKKAEKIASILVVPMVVEKKTLGLIALYTAEPRDFSRDDIAFLEALATHSGIAIQKQRLIDRLKKNSELFFSLSESLNSSLDIKKILHIMTAEIAEAFNAKGISISLMDEEKQELKRVASYGLSENYLATEPASMDTFEEILKNRIEVVPDIEKDSRTNRLEEKKAENIASMLNLPIKVKEKPIGLMKVYCSKRRHFSQDAVQLMTSIANQGGLAIQNASMYLELAKDKEELEKDIWSHRSWF